MVRVACWSDVLSWQVLATAVAGLSKPVLTPWAVGLRSTSPELAWRFMIHKHSWAVERAARLSP
jgi:hypothetical protein